MSKLSAVSVIVLFALVPPGAASTPATSPPIAESFSGSPTTPVPFGWEASVQLTNDAYNDICESNGWQVATDIKGYVHVIYCQTPTSGVNSSAYWRMWDQRNPWSSPVRVSLVSPVQTSVNSPSIAADSSGNIWFAWSATNQIGQQHIYVRRYSPVSGMGAVDSCSVDPVYNRNPVVQCLRDTVHVVWQGRVSPDYPVLHRAKQVNAIGQWTALVRLSDNTVASWPSFSAGRDGRLHVVWLGSGRIVYRPRVGSDWRAPEWASDTLLVNYKAEPTVAVDTSGTVHVAWRQALGSGGNTYYQEYYNCRSPSGAWLPSAQRLTDETGDQYSPRLSCDDRGWVNLVWYGYHAGGIRLFLRRRVPPAPWQASTMLASAAGLPSHPSLATCAAGNLHLVWHDTTGGVNGSDHEFFYRRYKARHDVGILRIAPPGSDVDSVFSVVTPTCTTVNYGELSESYRVRMRIGSFYDQTVLVSGHDSASKREVRFPTFSAWPRGDYFVRCSLGVVGDTWFGNDTLSKRITGHVHDVRCDTMFAPPAQVDSNSPPVFPQVRVRNAGSEDETFNVTFRISDGYNQTLPVSLSDGDTQRCIFPAWNHGTLGVFVAVCSTKLAVDANRSNDLVQRSVGVRIADIAVQEIEFPKGTVDSAGMIAPRVRFLNRGNLPATFDAWFRFADAGGTVYSRQMTVADLGPAQESAVAFPEWPQPHIIGNYVSRCSVYQTGDVARGNDTMGGAFIVRAFPPPRGGVWVQKASLPPGGKQKSVKDGGAVTYDLVAGNDTGFVFALKGNGTCEFYRYNTLTDAWVSRESIPAVNRLNKKKAVKKGSSLAAIASGMVYATKGNNTLDLWQYDPVANRWAQRADVPPGSRALKEGAGMAAAEVAGSEYLFLLKGSGTNEFCRYDATADAWSSLPSPPLTSFKKGSCIAWDGGDTVFVLKGSTNEFLSYSIVGGTWDVRVGLPFNLPGSTRRKKVKDGAGMAYYSRVVYALKGGATNEFWTYPCDSHNWTADSPMEPSPLNKTVKGGGCLTYAENRNAFYALRGNNTREFWMYTARTTFAGRHPPSADREPKNAQGKSTFDIRQPSLSVSPNPFTDAAVINYSLPWPGNLSLNLYDISGRLVRVLAAGHHPAGVYSVATNQCVLARGVYLLVLEGGGICTTKKLIVE
jgi:hypothetical protein